MKTAYQREWEARRALGEAHRDLERAAGTLLAQAEDGRLLTRATESVLELGAALARCRLAREALRDAALDPAPPPQRETHAFAPDAAGHCTGCGKVWVGGHPPIVAPPIVEGGSL